MSQDKIFTTILSLDSCVIWTGHQMLKWASNFECLLPFLFSLLQKKRMNLHASFVMKLCNLFQILKVPQNEFRRYSQKSKQQRSFDIQHLFVVISFFPFVRESRCKILLGGISFEIVGLMFYIRCSTFNDLSK